MNRLVLPLLVLLAGCPVSVDPTDAPVGETDPPSEPPAEAITRIVQVTLDGAPVEGAVVVQPGVDRLHRTDAEGRVTVQVDLTVPGDHVLVASHPDARQGWQFATEASPDPIEIALQTYDPADNLEYVFQDPGTPDRRDNTNQCAHCHNTLNDDWYASPHRTAASNPHVHDLYSGTASALADRTACETAGGTWASGLQPGTGAPTERCYLGTGVLPELDPSCAPNCDGRTEVTGQCADCHAPGIDGQLGGRHLSEATGIAYEAGVHCDVCHKVDVVSVEDPEPGVAGKLTVHRPSEPDPNRLAGPFVPIQFGPHHDVPNPRMGSVQRDHYESGRICAGCHEHDQAVLLPGATLDAARWPDGRLPVHSTWTEWERGPFGGEVPCNACHMPPAPGELNSANLQDLLDILDPGVAGGWPRPAGAVRHHSWVGPRTQSSRMLELAGAVDVERTRAEDVLTVRVRTTNVGAGHRLPTGEPGRQVVLHVVARCGDQVLDVVGGDAIPEWVGTRARKTSDQDWGRWPGAVVGDTVRVVRRTGWRDDPGFGPFGDGTFTGEAAGNARTEVLAVRTVTAVEGESVTLDVPADPADFPDDAVALLGPPLGPAARAAPAAGAPGHAFARVLVDPEGRAGVPHHRATDVRLDNRLGPHQAVTTTHRFRATCEEPEVTASLTWRAHPSWLADEKRWDNAEKLMTEVRR